MCYKNENFVALAKGGCGPVNIQKIQKAVINQKSSMQLLQNM